MISLLFRMPRKLAKEGLQNDVRQKIQLFLYLFCHLSPCFCFLHVSLRPFICKKLSHLRSTLVFLNHLPGLKEDAEMAHLPCASHGKDNQLDNGPGHSVSVGGLTLVTELCLVVLYTRHCHRERTNKEKNVKNLSWLIVAVLRVLWWNNNNKTYTKVCLVTTDISNLVVQLTDATDELY